jgi:SAM-dependent methyltransferase
MLEAQVLTAQLSAICPPQLQIPLVRYLNGEISGEILLMHFALQICGNAAVISIVERLAAASPDRHELAQLVTFAAANADCLSQITALKQSRLVDLPTDSYDGVAAIRAQFDKAVRIAPEASVALYSLGSPEILDRASDEIVTRLGEWGLLRPDLAVLDIGCGIGRIERALAPHVATITAIDLSPGMIDEARRRCRGLANVSFAPCTGRDLAGFRDESFDLVLAVDSFPYLFAADPAVAAQHVQDAARVLRPGGMLAILNFTYRGDEETDRKEIARLAAANGFAVRRAGTREFKLWDGLTFLLALPPRRE